MSKAGDIYWDRAEVIRRNEDRERSTEARTARPRWLSFFLILVMTISLCVTVNYRSFTELHGEINENKALTDQIQNLTDENLALQEEIHNLKTDPKTIEHEAKKLGLARPTEKSPVPGN